MKVTSLRARLITVELSEKEATILCALVGGIVWNADNKAGDFLQALWARLDEELPGRRESYSDFFTGNVETRGAAK